VNIKTIVKKTLSPSFVTSCRDEYWTELGLDWVWPMTNFVDFGLDPDCKMLHKFRIRTGFGLSWWKWIV